MAELPLADGIPRFKGNEDRFDRFTNGTDTQSYTTSGGTSVPSIRKFLKDKDAEINSSASSILAGSEAARDAAVTAQGGAEAARDAAAGYAATINSDNFYSKSEIDTQQALQDSAIGVVASNVSTLQTTVAEIEAELDAGAAGTARVVPYMLFGLQPENIDANTERFANGGMSVNGGYTAEDVHPLVNPARWQDVALTTQGAGGRDWATLTAANGLTVYFYLLIHATDPSLNSVIASLSLSNSGVNIPSGYASVLQIPHAKIYHPTLGLMPHHVKGGRPWSIHLTGYNTSAYYVLPGTENVAGTGAYVDINCASLVPNPARLARFRYKMTRTSADGALFAQVVGLSNNKEIGYVSGAGDVDTGEFEIRLSSTGIFKLKWPAGVTLNFLTLVEYTISEYT